MRALPDKWNPRLWVRDWLTAPSKNEAKQAARIQVGIRAAMRSWHAKKDGEEVTRESDAAQPGEGRPPLGGTTLTPSGSPDP